MKTMSLFFLFSLIVNFAHAGGAGGFDVGSGGDSIACKGEFTFCNNSDCSKFSIQGAVTQEFFISYVTANATQREHLARWSKLSYGQTILLFFEKLKVAQFDQKILAMVKQIGTVEDNALSDIGMGFDLWTVNDSVLPFELPAQCRQLQTINRSELGFLIYNVQSWNLLGQNKLAHQQAFMNMHEWFYHYAKTVRGHTNSLKTQNVMVELLRSSLNEQETLNLLRAHDFID